MEKTVGDADCRIQTVVQTLFSGSTNSELVKHWRNVASALAVPSEDTEPLRNRYSFGAITIKEVYEEVLTLWRGVKGTEAKVSVLIEALQAQSTLSDAAGLLRMKFSDRRSESGGVKSASEALDEKRGKHIAKNMDRLSKVTTLRIGILAKLLSSGYFSDQDLDALDVIKKQAEKNFHFYSLLRTRTEAYDTVIAAFNEHCQVKVAEILSEVYK